MTKLLSFVLSFALLTGTAQAQVVSTYHYDNYRSGWNQNETTLTPANVSSLTLKYAVSLDEQVDAQPLYVNGTVYVVTDQGGHSGKRFQGHIHGRCNRSRQIRANSVPSEKSPDRRKRLQRPLHHVVTGAAVDMNIEVCRDQRATGKLQMLPQGQLGAGTRIHPPNDAIFDNDHRVFYRLGSYISWGNQPIGCNHGSHLQIFSPPNGQCSLVIPSSQNLH